MTKPGTNLVGPELPLTPAMEAALEKLRKGWVLRRSGLMNVSVWLSKRSSRTTIHRINIATFQGLLKRNLIERTGQFDIYGNFSEYRYRAKSRR